MLKYTALRLAGLLPTAFLISLISFAIVQITPGDPAVLLLQQRGMDPTADAVLEMREELGLGKSFWERYLLWIWRVGQGDLGHSFFTGETVATEIIQRIPATLELTLAAITFSAAATFLLGLLAAKYDGKLPDKAVRAYALFAVSLPSYWLGLILMYLFAVKLQWLPAVGRGEAANLILPAVSLGFTSAAVNARLLHNGLLETLKQDYVTFARTKGLNAWQVMIHHALRPSLLPVITSMGNTFGHMLGGAVIIESIFAWPGLGKMIMDAIFNRDYPVIQGYILVMAALYTIVNMLTDLLCVWLDPRVRLGSERRL